MDKETVDKAIELQDKIKYYEGCISVVEEFCKEGNDVCSFELKYKKDDSCLMYNFTLSSYNDETLKGNLDACGKIVASYMMEIFKLKLNRLKEEYKNL